MSEAMVCKCCGHWRVTAMVLEREPGWPRSMLRITNRGAKVADVYTVDDVQTVLARYNIDIGMLVPA